MRSIHMINTILNGCLLVFLLGCSSGGLEEPDGGYVTGEIWITAYIPYVEEVVLPQQAYAYEDFSVTLRISSLLEPRLLNGSPVNKLISDYGVFTTHRGAWKIEPWMREILPEEGPAVDQITIDLPGLPAGEWEIGIDSPKRRELGGMHDDYEVGEGGGASSPDVETRTYPITVIERPET